MVNVNDNAATKSIAESKVMSTASDAGSVNFSSSAALTISGSLADESKVMSTASLNPNLGKASTDSGASGSHSVSDTDSFDVTPPKVIDVWRLVPGVKDVKSVKMPTDLASLKKCLDDLGITSSDIEPNSTHIRQSTLDRFYKIIEQSNVDSKTVDMLSLQSTTDHHRTEIKKDLNVNILRFGGATLESHRAECHKAEPLTGIKSIKSGSQELILNDEANVSIFHIYSNDDISFSDANGVCEVIHALDLTGNSASSAALD
jgi:hypothetical protein